jgi:signal transduction histidine kinase/DNA-binding LacI/PurR family transcriptional regulator/AraC-like DNA-binding protein
MTSKSILPDLPQARGPTIGLLSGRASSGSHFDLWSGVTDATSARRANLFCFAGKYLHLPQSSASKDLADPDYFDAQGNVIYEMIDKERVDGLIIWTSSLGNYISRQNLKEFCERYRPLPMVGVGMILEGIPSILLDSYGGMRDAIVHLIEAHGRRRLAFIRGLEGHRDAEERYRAYRDVLQEFGLPFDPSLVSPPLGWSEAAGLEAIRILLDERHVTLDAVVAANDHLAASASKTLQSRGMRVPDDVAIVGFNDDALGRIITPPLTTIPLQMYERGRQAAKMLLGLLDGQPGPEQVTVPTHLIVRQSCGCLEPAAVQLAKLAPLRISPRRDSVQPMSAGGERLAARRIQILEDLKAEVTIPAALAELVIDAFFAAMTRSSAHIFLSTLQDVLGQVKGKEGDLAVWQNAISILQYRVLPDLVDDQEMLIRAQAMWHQARVMIGEVALRSQTLREWRAQQQSMRMRTLGQQLATTASARQLVDILARELPLLGIPRCFLALYEDSKKPTEWSRLILGYDESGRLELGPRTQHFPSPQLVPDDLLSPKLRYNMAVEPLYFRDENLGFVLLERGPMEGDIYETLREEISHALKVVLLLEQSVQLYQQARDAQQIAEEADRLKSRFLSMVSHELRTPLVLLVGLSEIMLREYGGRFPLPEPYHQDLARMHVGAQQLDGLIRDVLDLTRSQMGQLKLMKNPTDLVQVLNAVALIGEELAHGKGLQWKYLVPDRLPRVLGDQARLQQVVLNLVTNAVKFTARGQVSLKATVNDDGITVSVADTGLGVPLEEQQVIFDEFRQSERTVGHEYGGLGLGLAICRQLVELHGGTIGVKSSGVENTGSIFFITLPLMPNSQGGDTNVGGRAQRVLVLTEDKNTGARLQEYLDRNGFAVELQMIDESPDWRAKVISAPPGAVVLDIHPASEQGWEVMQALKENPATQNVPVLFFSLMRDSGAVLSLDYMRKPVGVAALTQALQSYGLDAGECRGPVLIVDDDPAILDVHSRMVKSHVHDCQVLEASNGWMALDVMRRERPALVLLDLMMPDMDGFGVIEVMQKDDLIRDIPVIVLTAQALTTADMARLNRGVAAVLEKGLFSPAETMDQIQQVLARHKNLGRESQRITSQVMAFIHEHFGEPISRENMAAHAGVSVRHLTRCFVQEMNISPLEYLQRYRVKQAKRLLRDKSKSVTEIAHVVGFSDSNYFSRAFRREAGISPSAYQAGERANSDRK